MKKIYMLFVLVLCVSGLSAQETLIFSDGFDDSADISEVLATWTLKNGDAADAELLASDNTLDASSTKMVKVVAPTGSSDAWSLQLASPLIDIIVGNQYKVEFDMRAEGEGLVRISTGGGQVNNQYWEDKTITDQWTTFTYETVYGATIIAEGTELELNFDMGTVSGMTYYIDNVKVYDLGTPTSVETPEIEDSNTVTTSPGIIQINDAQGSKVEVYSLTGSRIFSQSNAGSSVSVNVAPGLYIVVVDSVSTKVVVK